MLVFIDLSMVNSLKLRVLPLQILYYSILQSHFFLKTLYLPLKNISSTWGYVYSSSIGSILLIQGFFQVQNNHILLFDNLSHLLALHLKLLVVGRY